MDRDELLRQAAALDDRAARSNEGDVDARRQAAELRARALGPRPYPVLVCEACFELTGWLGGDGLCARCVRRRLERAGGAHFDPVHAVEEAAPFLRRVKRAIGVGTARDRVREWLTKVEPGETGPVQPEEGWALEWAVKGERAAPEGPDLLVVFDVQSYRFEFAAWRAAETSPGGKPRRLVPRELPASLPIAALAEAWNDFEEEVAAHNRAVWTAESARRDGQAQAAADRAAAFELERGTSALL